MKRIFTLLCLMGLSISVFAQEDKPTPNKPVSPEVGALRTAASLAKYGYANYSATALLEAASIIANTPVTDMKADVTHGESDVAAAEKEQKVSFDPQVLVADALKFAGKDKTVAAVAKGVERDIKNASTRGAVGGANYHRDRVLAKTTDTYNVKFRGGELAQVAVVGDGDTDLDLYIYDENMNLIVSDTTYGDDCLCEWVPSWTGVFFIKVKNLGSVYNEYIIMTN